MNKVNSWDEVSKLETVVLGSMFDSSFFDGIKNTKVKDTLKKIADETSEDLDYFKEQVSSHGVEVFQASPTELGYKPSILDYVDVNGRLSHSTSPATMLHNNLIPTPPMQPRDNAITMGNKILITDPVFSVHGYVKKFKEWFGEESVDTRIYDGLQPFVRTEENLEEYFHEQNININLSDLKDSDKDELFEKYKLYGFCSPNLTRVGKTCFLDLWQTPDAMKWLSKHYPQFDYKPLNIGGHNDGIYSVLKEGTVISGPWFTHSEHIFPNWEIIYFDQDYGKVQEWFDFKIKHGGSWWVPGEEDNNEFTNFVDTWLSTWTGFSEETIFDINTLVLDDKYVVVNTDNPKLDKILKDRGLEPIYCPLRHRFFWDGGWHCCTLDIKRQGGQKDYGI